MEVSGLLHDHAALHPGKNPGTHRIRSCVGPRGSLDVLKKIKISFPYQDSKPTPSSSLKPSQYTDNATPAPDLLTKVTNSEPIFQRAKEIIAPYSQRKLNKETRTCFRNAQTCKIGRWDLSKISVKRRAFILLSTAKIIYGR